MEKKKTHTSSSLQHTSSCMHAVLNTVYSSVTWLSGSVTIRVEWPGGMHDNGFLRGFHPQGNWIISLLKLKIYSFLLLQRNYNQSRLATRKLRESLFLKPSLHQTECCVSVVAVIKLHTPDFSIHRVTSSYLKYFNLRRQSQEWLCGFFHSLSFTFCFKLSKIRRMSLHIQKGQCDKWKVSVHYVKIRVFMAMGYF